MKIPFLSLLILCLTFCSCTIKTEVQTEDIIARELQLRFKEYANQKNAECRDNILLEAEIHVDSIIYELSQFNILEDSIKMIAKPHSPERPTYIKITDTSQIVPFPIDSIEQIQ